MYLLIYGIVALVVVLALLPTIGTNVVFLVVGIVLGFALLYRNNAIKENVNKVSEEALHVVNLEKGGVFELHGVGDNYDDLNLTVIARHLYQEGDFYWYELECDKGSDEKVWVEVEDDDETVVTVVLKKMKLNDIEVTPSFLEKVDDEESGYIKSYKYSDSGAATFFRFCDDKKAEKLYYWDFVHENKVLSIEKWGERDYEVYISQKMRPNQIRVLRNKGN